MASTARALQRPVGRSPRRSRRIGTRSALALRSAHWVECGDLTWLNVDSNAIAFERNRYASITNFGDSNIALPPGEVILTAIHSAHRDQLAPNATVWLRLT